MIFTPVLDRPASAVAQRIGSVHIDRRRARPWFEMPFSKDHNEEAHQFDVWREAVGYA